METLKMETLTKCNCKDPDQIMRDLAELDLDCIKIKLMLMQKEDTGKHWSMDKIDHVADMYKNFLYLSATQDEPVVPTRDIDELWHVHILDTEKYAADCDRIFGRFIHHFPYFGIRSTEDRHTRKAAFKRTGELYEKAFGKKYSKNDGEMGSCNDEGCTPCVGGPRAIDRARPSFKEHQLMHDLGLITYKIIA